MSLYTIVRSNRLNSFQTDICEDAVVYNMFEELSPLKKMILEFMLLSHSKIPDTYFNQNLRHVSSETLIVFDGHARPEFLRWLIRVNPGKRFIFWCWNTVSEIENNLSLKDIPPEYEIWSYSEFDCRQNNLRYNTTFFWNQYDDLSSDEYDSDIYFIGKDKGRYKKIKKLERAFTDAGIQCKFQVVPTHPWNYRRGFVQSIPYDAVIQNIRKAKAIMDICVSKTAGPTLRSIEAAFYKKKIVSDDMNIMKMKFYNQSNTFILGGGILSLT